MPLMSTLLQRVGQDAIGGGTRRAEWRKRVGVEPTRPGVSRDAYGFEVREGHRTPFASGRDYGLNPAGVRVGRFRGCRARSGFAHPPFCGAAVNASALLGQAPGPRTYVNPMDIDYKYNFEQLNEKISYRQAADPVILNHKERVLPVRDGVGRVLALEGPWSLAVRGAQRDGRSRRWSRPRRSRSATRSISCSRPFSPRPILSTKAPATGHLEFYNRLLPPLPGALPDGTPSPYPPGSILPGPWDPQFFHDEATGRWYLYLGLVQRLPDLRHRARSRETTDVHRKAAGALYPRTPRSTAGNASGATTPSRGRPTWKARG